MAEDSAQSKIDAIENELSVSNFAKVQARTTAYTFGGTAIGGGVGYLAAKSGLGKWLSEQKFVDALLKAGGKRVGAEKAAETIKNSLSGDERQLLAKTVITFGGAIIGTMIGSMASMYEHWRKVERERLSVQEINKDVAHIMEKRVQFEQTLDDQQKIIESLKPKEAVGPASAKILENREAATTAKSAGV